MATPEHCNVHLKQGFSFTINNGVFIYLSYSGASLDQQEKRNVKGSLKHHSRQIIAPQKLFHWKGTILCCMKGNPSWNLIIKKVSLHEILSNQRNDFLLQKIYFIALISKVFIEWMETQLVKLLWNSHVLQEPCNIRDRELVHIDLWTRVGHLIWVKWNFVNFFRAPCININREAGEIIRLVASIHLSIHPSIHPSICNA